MPVIIDGNNLIGSSPDIKLNDPDARIKIMHLLENYQDQKKNNLVVVFDGEPNPYSQNDFSKEKIKVIYPFYGNSADDEIKRLLDTYTDFRDVVLVSSDSELKSFAKEKGAKIINSIEFYFELKRTFRKSGLKAEKLKRINAKLSKTEVDHWLKVFKDD
jgi:predicted RNA-binding protein with PIN domain